MAIAEPLIGDCSPLLGWGLIYSVCRSRTILETYLKGLKHVLVQEPDTNTECRF